MIACPECGRPYNDGEKCEVPGCSMVAAYEGWHRVIDHLTGKPRGLIQIRRVCEDHKMLLIGFQKQAEKKLEEK